MKSLSLFRHAKSDWDAVYETDYDRPLNERGVRSARLMGRLLADRRLVPDFVITSSAVRARDTVQLAIDAGGWECELRLEPELYGTGPAEVLEVAAEAPPVPALMLVGHQPTWSAVAERLVGEFVPMKTATVAVISLPIEDWVDLPDASGDLVEVIYPRDYYGSVWDRP